MGRTLEQSPIETVEIGQADCLACGYPTQIVILISVAPFANEAGEWVEIPVCDECRAEGAA